MTLCRCTLAAFVVAALLAMAVSPLAAAADLSSVSTFVEVNDPSWFFSPWNWNPLAVPGELHSNNPGAYFKTSFSGGSFLLQLNATQTPDCAYMTLRWSVDGGVYKDALLPWALDSESRLTLAYNLPALPDGGPHSLVFFVVNSHQLTDRWTAPVLNKVAISGAWLDEGASLAPYPFLYAKRLMVYWDSIGEGVAVNGYSNPPSDLTDNDSTHNWVQVLAQSLRAEVGAVAYGAQGWLRDGSFHALMNIYNDTEASYAWSRYDSAHSRLDASGLLQPSPDLVLMGHGTNDMHSPPEQVSACARAWLDSIVVAAPNASVVMTIPFGQFQAPALQGAWADFQKSSPNPQVHLLNLADYNAQQGLSGGGANAFSADGIHPLAFRAEQLGGFLTAGIMQLQARASRSASVSAHLKDEAVALN